MSISSFDENQHQPAATDDALAVKRAEVLKQHEGKWAQLQQQIKEAQGDLDNVNAQIEARTSDLAAVYQEKTEELKSQVGILTAQIDQKKSYSIMLDQEIASKQAEMSALGSNLFIQEADLKQRMSELDKSAHILADGHAALSDANRELANQEINVKQRQDNFETEISRRSGLVDEREKSVLEAEADLRNRQFHADTEAASMAIRLEQLESQEADIKQRLTDIQPILAHATELAQQKIDLDARAINLKAQLDQITEDRNRQATTTIAQANKEADLQRREAIIKQVEQKIAEGVT